MDLERDSHVSGASVNSGNTWRMIYEAQTMTARGQVANDRRGDSNSLVSASVCDVRNGRLSRVCLGNGVGFDASGCTTTTTTDQSKALQNLRFSFDEAGNLRVRSHVVNGQTVVESFAYDALNRLI